MDSIPKIVTQPFSFAFCDRCFQFHLSFYVHAVHCVVVFINSMFCTYWHVDFSIESPLQLNRARWKIAVVGCMSSTFVIVYSKWFCRTTVDNQISLYSSSVLTCSHLLSQMHLFHTTHHFRFLSISYSFYCDWICWWFYTIEIAVYRRYRASTARVNTQPNE